MSPTETKNMRRITPWLIGLGAVAIIIAVIAVLGGTATVPSEFTEARQKAANSAQTIATLLNASLDNLSAIARYDREGDAEKATAAIDAETAKSQARQEAAIELAANMDEMARAIPKIHSEEARQAALEAVSAQVAAVSHLVAYNDHFTELVNLLGEKFEVGKNVGSRVDELISELNQEANAINELNQQFSDSLKEFDAIIGA